MKGLQALGVMGALATAACLTGGVRESFAEVPVREQGALTAGDAVLDDGSLYDQYTFSATSGQFATISLESNDFDPYLILLDPNGQRISENDDISRTNQNARVVVTLPTTGVYTAVANSYESGRNGNYFINIDVESTQSRLYTVLAAAAVPNSTRNCRAAIVNAVSEIKTDRELDVLVGELDLNRLYSTVPSTRPNGVNFSMTGAAAASVLQSPRFLTQLANTVVSGCGSVGAVVFETTGIASERTFGWLPAQRQMGRRPGRAATVAEFRCVAPPEESALYNWGQQSCSGG
ncbi:MAG: PPC domain-containing protein [Cyanobacteria bacterium J06627_28]